MFPQIYQWLSADARVVELVEDKLYQGILPQSFTPATAQPYVVWDMSGGFPQNYLGDNPGIDHQVIDFRCYARDPSVAAEVAEAVRDVLQAWGQSASSPITEWEFETKLHVVMLSFSFWTNRA